MQTLLFTYLLLYAMHSFYVVVILILMRTNESAEIEGLSIGYPTIFKKRIRGEQWELGLIPLFGSVRLAPAYVESRPAAAQRKDIFGHLLALAALLVIITWFTNQSIDFLGDVLKYTVFLIDFQELHELTFNDSIGWLMSVIAIPTIIINMISSLATGLREQFETVVTIVVLFGMGIQLFHLIRVVVDFLGMS